MSRILQAANFVAPHSGGIRTVLEHLAAGYAGAGHEVIQVIPGKRRDEQRTAWGHRVTLPGLPVPATGYRVLRPGAVAAVAALTAPDTLEVHDRSTLRGLGRWGAERGIPAVAISHERLDRLLEQWLPAAVDSVRLAQRSNAALAAGFDAVICTTKWAAEEFDRLPVRNVHRVRLGVDVVRFSPNARDRELHARLAPDSAALLVLASRLSREKRPDLAVAAVSELIRRGQHVRLVIAGDGPQRKRLSRQAQGLPVTFLGHLRGADQMAALLATADVVLAPGPVETFGLAALEALASGTPVVANASSALTELLEDGAGLLAEGSSGAFADAVQEILRRPAAEQRAAARRRGEQYDWAATVSGFLDVHRLRSTAAVGRPAAATTAGSDRGDHANVR